ncbi:hypothetical protein FXO38_06542 [Capsicum annuum]|nr:hypothetical protein FXO38_06542 [Capsicum annuum]
MGPCISGFIHIRKVIAVDGTRLHGKYKGVLLSTVAQDTKNHNNPIAFCIVDKENDTSWMLFFENLKPIVVDGPYLYFKSPIGAKASATALRGLTTMLIRGTA